MALQQGFEIGINADTSRLHEAMYNLLCCTKYMIQKFLWQLGFSNE